MHYSQVCQLHSTHSLNKILTDLKMENAKKRKNYKENLGKLNA